MGWMPFKAMAMGADAAGFASAAEVAMGVGCVMPARKAIALMVSPARSLSSAPASTR